MAEYAAAKHLGLNGLLYAGILVEFVYSIVLILLVRRLFGIWLVGFSSERLGKTPETGGVTTRVQELFFLIFAVDRDAVSHE